MDKRIKTARSRRHPIHGRRRLGAPRVSPTNIGREEHEITPRLPNDPVKMVAKGYGNVIRSCNRSGDHANANQRARRGLSRDDD
ncbi:hypothetical protein L596_008278 [Steinernema carpocapsae]|uniref:Uncharacterized protein n=1 Tax=Steinernema carpocapsae TaxID=34508 RepID=A0A4U5PC92_STECR|nr:hypothetical protein L596_008278 [Steinernema carpocapsae]